MKLRRTGSRARAGQALVEWAVFAAAILILWTQSLSLAKRLLNRTMAESWSLVAARQALSRATVIAPPATVDGRQGQLATRASRSRATATATFGAARTTTALFLPSEGEGGASKGLSSFSSLFSGFRSFVSSE